MQKAAARFDFEKAAELRDMVEDLRKTVRPNRTFERGARARVMSTIDPMADVKELQELLHLERPPLVMECFDIANIGTAHCVASMVRFENGVPNTSNYRRYRIKAVSGQNDFISMAEVVRRRYSRVLLEAKEELGEEAESTDESAVEVLRRLDRQDRGAGEHAGEAESQGPPKSDTSSTVSRPLHKVLLPDLIIVDGGKGQLSMAVKELQRLGLHGVAIVGLAKEREEVFFPGDADPVVIPHDRGALKLLQRIRDEAHRWANSYHQLLLKRRVEESILDECPGVSQTRKSNLLRAFGSVARLRKATAAQIAEVPGISKGLAEDILRFLVSRQADTGE